MQPCREYEPGQGGTQDRKTFIANILKVKILVTIFDYIVALDFYRFIFRKSSKVHCVALC